MFALGVGGGVKVDQLRQIASSNDNVFTSPSFEELINVVKPIVEKSCPSKGTSSAWKKRTCILSFPKGCLITKIKDKDTSHYLF